MRLRLHIRNKEKYTSQDAPFVVIANHQSALDVLSKYKLSIYFLFSHDPLLATKLRGNAKEQLKIPSWIQSLCIHVQR